MPAEIHTLHKTSRVGATAEYRAKDWRFARDQREAGIEHLEWEDRLPPFRPWMFWLAVLGSWAIFTGAFWSLVTLIGNI